MIEVSRQHGVRYPHIEQLSKKLIATFGTVNKITAKVVCEPGGLLCELVINRIYDNKVTFEIPNGKGGHRYMHLSYEQVEYPPYSMAARACAMNDAQTLYLIDDEKMGKNKREKQEALRRKYVEEHWQDFYDDLVIGMQKFFERQEPPLLLMSDVLAWIERRKEIAIELKQLQKETAGIEHKLKAAKVFWPE